MDKMKPIICPEEQIGECIDIKNGNAIIRISIIKWWRSTYLSVQPYYMDVDIKKWRKDMGGISIPVDEDDCDLTIKVMSAVEKVINNYMETKK